MYDEFGKMDLDGINAKAEELANAGRNDDVFRLAKENGLPGDLASMYIEGETDFLCEDITDAALGRIDIDEGETDFLCEDITDAALGRIDIEADDIGAEEIMGDWADYIRSLIMDRESVALAVMDPKKSFVDCVGKLTVYSIMHAEPAPPEIIKAMKDAVTDAQLKKLHMEKRHIEYTKIGMPGMGTAKRLIREYYGEG